MKLIAIQALAVGLALSASAQNTVPIGFPKGHQDALGTKFKAARVDQPPSRCAGGTNSVSYWNEVALDTVAIDHTPVAQGESRVFGEELGPARTSWALAIVQIAVFDAVNAIEGGYQSYTGLPAAGKNTSVDTAVAQATHDTLVAPYPSQQPRLDGLLATNLDQLSEGKGATNGVELGQRAAAAILALRAGDGSQVAESRLGTDIIPSNLPGKWRPDPISQNPLALGAHWGEVQTFGGESTNDFGVPAPPAMDSPEYTKAYDEVKRLGGDGVVTPTERTADQTLAAIFWAYDGSPGIGVPPRFFNQITVDLAEQRSLSIVDQARLLALVNVAMADTGIVLWQAKYGYDFWRPITGIRESDPGTGPTGAGDGNSATVGDPTYTPLGAPASNLSGPNFTPPFPSYPSGHAGFAGAVFEIMRKFFGTDTMSFTIVSDELNGVTRDNKGNVRPLAPRTFSSFSQAEEEVGQSRIYMGIHWAFDKTAGIAQGRKVGDYILGNVFAPASHSGHHGKN